jgi:hypothetical protein
MHCARGRCNRGERSGSNRHGSGTQKASAIRVNPFSHAVYSAACSVTW